MWGKRPKPGGKGLRCAVKLSICNAPAATCDRPAKRYEISKSDYKAGTFDICKGHMQWYLRDGWTCKVIDRRKKA